MVTHDLLVRGSGLDLSVESSPALFSVRDLDFPARFLSDIGRPAAARVSTAARIGRAGTNTMKLLQPVQRVLPVALLDVACDVVGVPRVDPRRIESAGVVIRRVPDDGGAAQRGSVEAWLRSADGKFAWRRLSPSEEDLDPDPARRPSPASGQAELDRLLVAHAAQAALTETTSPAFVAMPEVCERVGRTLVFALVPTASPDVADISPTLPDYGTGALRQQLPPLLDAGTHTVPLATRVVSPRYLSASYLKSNQASDFLRFVNLLKVVAIEFDAFADTAQAARLVAAMNRRSVVFGDGTREPVGDFLRRAKAQLLDADQATVDSSTLWMPAEWESSDEADAGAILDAAADCLRARSAGFLPREGRYQDSSRLYRLRVFLRVKGHDSCPPSIVWSDYSEPFTIAPWYESSGVMGPPVPLPKPTRDFFKNAKPNVSFVVPDSLMNAMEAANMKDLVDGTGTKPAGLDLTWICGFSIPLITICAFFVLNIFLVLLNIVFFWLPFIKICIPFPTSQARSQGGA